MPFKNFSSMIVFGILMFVSIFLVVIAFKNKKLTIYKVLSIISTVTFIFLLVMSIIDYTKKITQVPNKIISQVLSLKTNVK